MFSTPLMRSSQPAKVHLFSVLSPLNQATLGNRIRSPTDLESLKLLSLFPFPPLEVAPPFLGRLEACPGGPACGLSVGGVTSLRCPARGADQLVARRKLRGWSRALREDVVVHLAALGCGSVPDCRGSLGEGLACLRRFASLMVFRESVLVPHESADGGVLRVRDGRVCLLALLQQRCWLPNPKLEGKGQFVLRKRACIPEHFPTS